MAYAGKAYIPGAPLGFAAARLCQWGPGCFVIELRVGGQRFFPVGGYHPTEDAAWAVLSKEQTELRADAAALCKAHSKRHAPNTTRRAHAAVAAVGLQDAGNLPPPGPIGVGAAVILQQQQASQGVLAGLGQDVEEEDQVDVKDYVAPEQDWVYEVEKKAISSSTTDTGYCSDSSFDALLFEEEEQEEAEQAAAEKQQQLAGAGDGDHDEGDGEGEDGELGVEDGQDEVEEDGDEEEDDREFV